MKVLKKLKILDNTKDQVLKIESHEINTTDLTSLNSIWNFFVVGDKLPCVNNSKYDFSIRNKISKACMN